MLHPKRGRIRFNDGEAAYLRSCMRRFGWERRSDPEANCLWEETFSGVKLHDVVWWLIEEILQTHVSAEACIRHDPITIAKARHRLRRWLRGWRRTETLRQRTKVVGDSVPPGKRQGVREQKKVRMLLTDSFSHVLTGLFPRTEQRGNPAVFGF